MTAGPIHRIAKAVVRRCGGDWRALAEAVSARSIHAAIRENGLSDMVEQLQTIVPNMSAQESRACEDTPFMAIKRRSLQAVQCQTMLEALSGHSAATVVDIGDSAGTHMLYLKALTAGRIDLTTLSVNLDPRAIDKIRARGLPAVLCRAEEVTERGLVANVDLMTSFEMVEHLHNPALFFRRLAKRSPCTRMVVSVPYLRQSRVGLHHLRQGFADPQYAEDVHIFELSPPDWTLLLLHSGWRVASSTIHYQYPRRWGPLSRLLAAFWRRYDFEGFWCAILERDASRSDLYCDWEE